MEMESGLCSKTAEMDSYICMPHSVMVVD